MKALRRGEVVIEGCLAGVEEDARPTSKGLRIAYLLSRYPAISHTFLLQEVLGLRAQGLHIETASINLPDRSMHELPPREAEETSRTHYIKDSAKSAAWALMGILMFQPVAVFRGLKTVFSTRNLTVRRRAYWLFYLAEALLIGRWMRERNLTHLHVHFGGPVASVGLLTSAAWKIPFSLTIHGPEELLDLSSNHLREKVERASFVFCISDFCRSQLYQLVAEKHWRKLMVVRLGVDPTAFSPEIRPSGKTGEMLEAVCIGRLVAAKGHRTLLEALLLLREQTVNIHLVLVGGGPEMPGLQEFVRLHRLSDKVTFTQALAHDEAVAYLRRADLFVLASFAEGIPVALMEAMALGIPCVSTFVAGIPELIRDGVDGLLVAPGNAQALADAIRLLAEEQSRRLTMGEAARQKVAGQYSLPRNHERLADAFEHFLTIPEQHGLAGVQR